MCEDFLIIDYAAGIREEGGYYTNEVGRDVPFNEALYDDTSFLGVESFGIIDSTYEGDVPEPRLFDSNSLRFGVFTSGNHDFNQIMYIV